MSRSILSELLETQDDGVLVDVVEKVAVGLMTGMVRPGSRLIVFHGEH